MTSATDKRHTPDRRRQPRGGCRPTDRPGVAPLVLVVDRDPDGRQTSEAILAKLRFAVAPVESVEQALATIPELRPDVIVANERDAARLREGPTDARIVVAADVLQPDALIEDIRRALRRPRSAA